MDKPLVFKKNPVVLVGSFVALQFATAGLYFLIASLADYGQIWATIPLLKDVDFGIAQTAFVFVAEVVFVFYMFFSWYRQTIRLTSDQLIFERGLLVRSHTVVPLSRIATATFRQSILGRLTHYGTVEVSDGRSQSLLRLDDMSDPQEFVDEIVRRKGTTVVGDDADPQQLLAVPEHERLERKSTFRWDLKTGAVNKALEKASMKTVAAFMNSQGGHLLLGVGDGGESVGLEADVATLARRDVDGLQNHFTNVLSTMLGPSLRQYVHTQPFTHEGRTCMLVSVSPSERPAYLRDQDHEEFFIRTGNGTTSLRMSEANAYIASRFRTK